VCGISDGVEGRGVRDGEGQVIVGMNRVGGKADSFNGLC